MITTKDIRFSYGKGTSFQFPDITASKGDSLLITGGSGKGKTTLLHLLGGLLRPQSGDVFIDEIQSTFSFFLKEHKRLLLKFYGYVYFLKDVWSISQQLKDFPCIALISSETGYNFLILKQDSQRQHKIELYFL